MCDHGETLPLAQNSLTILRKAERPLSELDERAGPECLTLIQKPIQYLFNAYAKYLILLTQYQVNGPVLFCAPFHS
jgi:hypothetical protein